MFKDEAATGSDDCGFYTRALYSLSSKVHIKSNGVTGLLVSCLIYDAKNMFSTLLEDS